MAQPQQFKAQVKGLEEHCDTSAGDADGQGECDHQLQTDRQQGQAQDKMSMRRCR
jgi:hypothetical protein